VLVKSLDYMARRRQKSSGFTKSVAAPPLIGALLRVPHEAVRAHILDRLHASGFNDIDQAHFTVLQYPGPQGRRPSDITAHAGVSKQAMNYLLNQLEERGYFERHADPDDARSKRIVLTRRGEAVSEVVRDAVTELEEEWAMLLGVRRFAMLKRLLRELYESCGQSGSAIAGSGRGPARPSST
jgi:DNA-binding MarR family transcriptional regulator